MKGRKDIINDLRKMSDPDIYQKMEYFGIRGAQALGIPEFGT